MKKTLLSLALMAATLGAPAPAFSAPAAAARPAQVGAPPPTPPAPAPGQHRQVRLFRVGDLAGLAQAALPREKWEMVRLAYETHRHKPTTEAERAHFAEKFGRLTAPDAVDQLMVEIEPKLAQARPQWPGMLLMGLGAARVAVNSPDSKLTDAQRANLSAALPGFEHWASSTDFLSSSAMRHALGLITDAARHTGITDIDQLKALPLEGVLERVSPVLSAAKQAVRGYGIDLDAIADSLRLDVLDRTADTAHVRATVTVFGAPVQGEFDLVLVEGHWYGKHTLDAVTIHDGDDGDEGDDGDDVASID
jgi:hypothetical protein